MVTEDLLYFVKFSVKVLVKGMDSDQARSTSLAHSGYKTVLGEVLWGTSCLPSKSSTRERAVSRLRAGGAEGRRNGSVSPGALTERLEGSESGASPVFQNVESGAGSCGSRPAKALDLQGQELELSR